MPITTGEYAHTPTGTTFGVAPSNADWYWRAVIDWRDGTDTTYVDGYAAGGKPTRIGVRTHHGWTTHFPKIIEWTVSRTQSGTR